MEKLLGIELEIADGIKVGVSLEIQLGSEVVGVDDGFELGELLGSELGRLLGIKLDSTLGIALGIELGKELASKLG